MFDHIGIEAAAQKFVEIMVTRVNFAALPEFHREKLLSATKERGAYEVCRFGIESTWAILHDEDVNLSNASRAAMVEALGYVSRIAVASQWAGKIDRWQGIQDWAWATHNGDPLPEASPDVLDEWKPQPEPEAEIAPPGPIPSPA